MLDNKLVADKIDNFYDNCKNNDKNLQIKKRLNKIKIDKTDFKKQEQKITSQLLNIFKKEKVIDDYFLDDNFILLNGECMQIMTKLIKQNIKIEHIITDIPYGTVQGLSIEGWKNKGNIPQWDAPLNSFEIFEKCFYLSKPNTNLLLFSQEPLTTDLINKSVFFQKYSLANKMIWVKNNHANGFGAKTTPLNYYEEILLFRKSLDETNSLELRQYFKNILNFIGLTKKEIMNELGQGLDHCFRYENRTFYVPTEKNYNALIEKYKINQMSDFISYEIMKNKWENENKIVFNLPPNQNIFKNVLEFKKDTNNIHPTQKPIALLSQLIQVFTNQNDTILDFTCGSASTGISAILNKRKFIGIEMNKDYYNNAIEWYKKYKKTDLFI
jgi:site-specific DNA-methyltransferase (adenine-specific)